MRFCQVGSPAVQGSGDGGLGGTQTEQTKSCCTGEAPLSLTIIKYVSQV